MSNSKRPTKRVARNASRISGSVDCTFIVSMPNLDAVVKCCFHPDMYAVMHSKGVLMACKGESRSAIYCSDELTELATLLVVVAADEHQIVTLLYTRTQRCRQDVISQEY